MREYFVICDMVTGAYRWGIGNPGDALLQALPEGYAVLVVPEAAYPALDLDIIRPDILAAVDFGAGATRSQFITVVPGQEATYLRKEQEARGWATGDDPATVPFLDAEATATGVSIDTLAATVIATADAWIVVGAKIEGARMGAKKEK